MTLGEFVVFLRALKPDSVHWTGSEVAVTKSNVCGNTIQLIVYDDGDAILHRITSGEPDAQLLLLSTELANVLPLVAKFVDLLAGKEIK